jgi:hypothetical protein
MFLKVNMLYEKGLDTYCGLINSETIESIEPIEEGEEDFDRGARTTINFINSRCDITETIFQIAERLKAV